MSASPRRCCRPSSPRARRTAARAASSAARFPARKTLEEFDFTFQRSVKKQVIEHLGQLDFLHERSNIVALGPPGTGKTHLAVALGIRACLAGQRVIFRTATEWVALLADAQRQGRLDDELRRLERYPLLICDEVGYIPFDPQAANLMFMLVSRRYERASLIVTSQQAVQRVGRDLRRRRDRRRDDRPARPPRRDPLAQGRFLPPQRPRPRRPPRPQDASKRPDRSPSAPPPRASERPRTRRPRPPSAKTAQTDPRRRPRRRQLAPLGATRLRSASSRRTPQGGQFSTGATGSILNRP